tara:strand:+ start:325 stop:540 length:216 start_codon:yes stop_codon:yes gene_type:complete
MNYPTLEEVNVASRSQICQWSRFLPSPGMHAIGRSDFEQILEKQVKIMNRIVERQTELGGFTPEISKAIGW